jgi:hypothetical protein
VILSGQAESLTLEEATIVSDLVHRGGVASITPGKLKDH